MNAGPAPASAGVGAGGSSDDAPGCGAVSHPVTALTQAHGPRHLARRLASDVVMGYVAVDDPALPSLDRIYATPRGLT